MKSLKFLIFGLTTIMFFVNCEGGEMKCHGEKLNISEKLKSDLDGCKKDVKCHLTKRGSVVDGQIKEDAIEKLIKEVFPEKYQSSLIKKIKECNTTNGKLSTDKEHQKYFKCELSAAKEVCGWKDEK